MTPTKRSPFVRSFYVANVMEIFERFAWYGFFTVSSLYLTTPLTQGGLGFTEQQRGIIQGLVPFFLYLLPVITGALGDRYGYRKMFIASFVVMTPSYFFLGQARSFWSFLFVFMAVAVGAAMFKPLVVGTVSRTTDDTNRGLGFGIFYTMVNLGGFLGPILAGAVRAISWNLVFVCAAVWIAVNFIPAIFFYRDPPSGDDEPPSTSLGQVLLEAQEVLGNGRFALVVVPLLVLLMIGGGGWMAWKSVALIGGAWLVINLVWNAAAKGGDNAAWYRRRIRIGNGPFVIYLLIIASFWTVYTQFFNTMPIYIRDHVETHDLVEATRKISPGLASAMASVNREHVLDELELAAQSGKDTADLRRDLLHHKIRVPEVDIAAALQDGGDRATTVTRWAADYNQIAPEYLMALNFACIMLFQILVSRFVERRKVFYVLVAGTLMLGIGYAMAGAASLIVVGGSLLVTALVVFSFGEMLASPKSQDYVAGVMPKAKAAMFMGYYFVSMALGFLFGGILSGWSYEYFSNQLHKPHLMWLVFGGLAVLTAVALMVYDKKVAPKLEASARQNS